MKALLLLGILALTMSAQNVEGGPDPYAGVSIGGTPTAPTIINHSSQPLLGYVIRRSTTTGVSNVFHIFSPGRIILDRTIKPGTEMAVGGFGLGFTNRGEGDSIGYNLKGVLFADGTFVGTDSDMQEISEMVYLARSYARYVQYLADRESALLRDGQAPIPQGASFDPRVQHRKTLANLFLGATDVDKAIARVAALPDVVKGE